MDWRRLGVRVFGAISWVSMVFHICQEIHLVCFGTSERLIHLELVDIAHTDVYLDQSLAR